MISDELAVMIFAYSKSAKEDLTADDRKYAPAIVKEFTDDQS